MVLYEDQMLTGPHGQHLRVLAMPAAASAQMLLCVSA